jgi:phosphatidylglycerophosphatase A
MAKLPLNCRRKAICILTNHHSRIDPDVTLLFSHPLHFLSLGLGTGLFPKAPGTAGTLLGFPLFWAIIYLPLVQQWLALILLFVLGIWCCAFTGRALGVSDHGAIVWDEIVAMAAILVTVPMTWIWWVAAFVLFRLFDIWKPFPISWADKHIGGGFGVMLDDGLAAAMAILVLQLMQR